MSIPMMNNSVPLKHALTETTDALPAEADAVITDAVRPDPEVKPKTDRRVFTAAYKRSIVEQAERCQGEGAIGALLRREGLYSSHLSNWRRAKREGTLEATKSQPRGPAAAVDAASQREITRLQTQNQRLENELEKARTIIDVQKKLSALLSMSPSDGKS